MPLTVVRAQYDPSFSQYWEMETAFNPAATGRGNRLHAVGMYAMSMVGFENAPKTMVATADMPFYAMRNMHGVGVIFMNDQLGLFSHQRIQAQYSYKQKLLGGRLGIGVQAGLLTEKFNGSKLDLENSGDPAFSNSEVNGNALDLGAGLYYDHTNWYVGVSALHLTAPTVKLGERNELQVDPSFYFTAGYNIKLRNPLLSIRPSVFAVTDAVAYKADVTCRLLYTHDEKVLWAGVGYSPTNSVTGYVGGSFHGVNLGYSYEMYTGGIKIGNGSHTLTVSYETEIDFAKHGRNMHKSVRLL